MRIILYITLYFVFITGCTNGGHQLYIAENIASNRAKLIKSYTPNPTKWGTIIDAYSEKNMIFVIIESSEIDHIKIINSRDEIMKNICSNKDVLNVLESGVSYKFIVKFSNKKSIFPLIEC